MVVNTAAEVHVLQVLTHVVSGGVLQLVSINNCVLCDHALGRGRTRTSTRPPGCVATPESGRVGRTLVHPKHKSVTQQV